jgi:hypothetical protein
MDSKKRVKTGGRTTGTLNKIPNELRVRISNFLDSKFDTIEQEFEELEGKDKVNTYLKLIEYVIPKMRSFEETTLSQLLAMTPEQRTARIQELQKQIQDEK